MRIFKSFAILAITLFAFANSALGQTLYDSFADGNFTASPVWGGNTTAYGIVANSDAAAGVTGSNTVRLSAPATATTEYLSSQISVWGTGQEWGFFFGRRAQALTAANQAYFWLYANESNLTSATVDGYRIAIGDDAGGDNIRLEYVVNGAVSVTVITSSGSTTNAITDIGYLVRVTRSSAGDWEIFTSTLPTANSTGAIATDIPNSTNANISQGTATNNTLVPTANGYLGFASTHTTGGSAIVANEFDQIYFTPSGTGPAQNGAIAASEYGTHTDGANQNTNSGVVTYVTWDATNLYVAATGANLAEGMVFYLDKDPQVPVNGGTNANGTSVGFNYDGANFAELQFRADLVMYVKSGYREYRTADGANGWSGSTSAFGSYGENGTGNIREFSIPWSAIGGFPTSMNFFSYITSSTGFVYGEQPSENGEGFIGTGARFDRYYTVTTTTVGSATPPFSRNSYVFNSTSDNNTFGAITVWDFTMNTSGRQIARSGTGAWTINGSLVVNNGSVYFGSGGTYGATTIANVNILGGLLSMDQTNQTMNITGNLSQTGYILGHWCSKYWWLNINDVRISYY